MIFCSAPVEVGGGLGLAFEATLQERRELNLLYICFFFGVGLEGVSLPKVGI